MNFKKILPHVVALAIFAAVSALFFYPQFQDKSLSQSDMIQYSGMVVDLNEHAEKYDEHPGWLGRMFGGMPSFATSFPSEGRYIGNNADLLNVLGQPSSMIFLTMAGFYLMLVMMGVNAWLAIAGGLAFGLSTYFPIIIGAGHITKMWALQWVAPMIGSIWWAYRKNLWVGAVLTGIFASLEIAAYHPQIAYYFMFVVIGLVINELIVAVKQKSIGRFAVKTLVVLAAGLLAVGSNFSTLYYTATYSTESTRGSSELSSFTYGADGQEQKSSGLDKNYATQWSYGKGETFNMFIPNLYGGGRDFKEGGTVDKALRGYDVPKGFYKNLSSYHGSQPFTEGPVYVGAVVVFLALFGFLVLGARQKWWIVGPMILALMLAWGSNLMWLSDWFLDYFPLYNKFRTVSMMLVVVQWALPVLAIVGLQKALDDGFDTKRVSKALTLSAIIAGGFAIFAAIALPSSMSFFNYSDASLKLPDALIHAMVSERAELLSADAWRTFLFVALTFGALFAYMKGWLTKKWVFAAVAVLVLIDMWGIDRRYVSSDDFMPTQKVGQIEMSEMDRAIKQDTTNYRVMNTSRGNPWQEAITSRFHRSVGGYHPAKLSRYQDLIEYHLSKNKMEVFNMLNTKYFISESGVFHNKEAFGNAWFVDTVKIVDNADQELYELGEVDLRTTVLVDRRFAEIATVAPTVFDSTATIAMTDYRVNRQAYKTSGDKDRLAVFSEIYYPGWEVTIDGQKAEPLRADYVLRAAVIPSGEHSVVWTFHAPHYDAVMWTNRICSLILLLWAAALIAMQFVKCKKKVFEDNGGNK